MGAAAYAPRLHGPPGGVGDQSWLGSRGEICYSILSLFPAGWQPLSCLQTARSKPNQLPEKALHNVYGNPPAIPELGKKE